VCRAADSSATVAAVQTRSGGTGKTVSASTACTGRVAEVLARAAGSAIAAVGACTTHSTESVGVTDDPGLA
jgi:hypothetical protein